MKKVRVEDAVGMTLCHDITAMYDGFKGAAFKRGHIITEEDVPRLLDYGKSHIFIWEENAGEIHEEDAALRLAAMAAAEGGSFSEPSEGKVVLRPEITGMFRVNKELLAKLNAIGDITISCIPDHYPVKPGDRLASMRIVPLVTKEAQIIEAEELCRGKKLFELLPYKPMKAGIIITGSEIYNGRIKDKFEPVARGKLSAYPCTVLGAAVCDDRLSMMTEAAEGFIAQGADLLIFSGGMSVDPDDLTPSAIRALGADIVTHGIPSQPGNMSLVAYKDNLTLLGVPGAAISLPTTAFDAMLPQVFTGSHFTKQELLGIAEGGLCQLCRVCHFPVCTFGRY